MGETVPAASPPCYAGCPARTQLRAVYGDRDERMHAAMAAPARHSGTRGAGAQQSSRLSCASGNYNCENGTGVNVMSYIITYI